MHVEVDITDKIIEEVRELNKPLTEGMSDEDVRHEIKLFVNYMFCDQQRGLPHILQQVGWFDF